MYQHLRFFFAQVFMLKFLIGYGIIKLTSYNDAGIKEMGKAFAYYGKKTKGFYRSNLISYACKKAIAIMASNIAANISN